MPSLREICRHDSVLVIDAASSVIQVGDFGGGESAGGPRWATSNDEAGVGVFQCVEELGIDPQSVGSFVFCEGPGSVLGIRTVAMAIRTWCLLRPRPVFTYVSLAIVAEALARSDVGVIADARRDSWHHFQLGRGLRRIAAGDLSGQFVMPENYRHWTPLPAGVERVPYSLAKLLPQVRDAELFQPTDSPDAFLHEEPNYATWTPQIHRAPVPR